MSKMHYFTDKFSKIAKRCRRKLLNLQYWWPEVPWLGQILFFWNW